MDILPTPTGPSSTPQQIKAFLQSLQQYPNGPNVCTSPVSFTDTKQKSKWIKQFPDAGFRETFTYSQAFTEATKENTRNKVVLFQRPVHNWVGLPKIGITWAHAERHAFALAWIKRPNVEFGKDLVVFDVDCLLPAEAGNWVIGSIPLVRGFVLYCCDPKHKKLINNVWYWQNTGHRGMGECLEHSLEWMKKLTLMGDQALSDMDWESQGFKKIGL
ncbi:hypothetical protein MMC29_000346 [Sticta canariensis]|nr:hypothetical protein [Sticta canariensis]